MGLKSRLREKRLAKKKIHMSSAYGTLVKKPKTPKKKKGA